jgi:hypothetical protein
MAASKTTFPEPAPPARTPVSEQTGERAEPAWREPEVFVASHDVLFAETSASLCDACGRPMRDGEGDREAEPTEGFGIPGRGVYLWTRGDETRIENVPLCASCASAIGMTALARWETEEEED